LNIKHFYLSILPFHFDISEMALSLFSFVCF